MPPSRTYRALNSGGPPPGRDDWPNRSPREQWPPAACNRVGQDRLPGHRRWWSRRRRTGSRRSARRRPASGGGQPPPAGGLDRRACRVDCPGAWADPDAGEPRWTEPGVVAAWRTGELAVRQPGASPSKSSSARRGRLADPTDPFATGAVLLCTLPMYGSAMCSAGYGLEAAPAAWSTPPMAGTDKPGYCSTSAPSRPHLRACCPAVGRLHPDATLPSAGRDRSQDRGTDGARSPSGGQRSTSDDTGAWNPVVGKSVERSQPLD